MKRIMIMGLVLFLSGCMERTEIGRLWLVAGLGVDKTDNGFLVTVQVVNPAAIAEDSPGLAVYTFSSEGSTIYEAYQSVDNLTTHVLYMAHLNAIVVDEKIAKDGIYGVLDFTLRHTEVRPDINILVAKDEKAQDILNVLTPIEHIPAMKLDIFTNMVQTHTARLINYNLYDTINLINGPGVNAILNSVSIRREDTDGRDDEKGTTQENTQSIKPPVELQIKHLAVFEVDKLVGYLNRDEAQLYSILRGESKRYVLESKIDNKYYIAFEVDKLDAKHHIYLDEERVKINCQVNGALVENNYPMDLSNNENVQILEDYLAKDLEKNLLAFIKKTQLDLGVDIIGIGAEAFYKDNKNWSALQGYWKEIYPKLDFEVNVDLEVESVGVIKNIR